LQGELHQKSQDERDIDEFIRRIRQYAEVEELDRTMALDLIHHVEVGAKDMEVREIAIHYKFLGKFED